MKRMGPVLAAIVVLALAGAGTMVWLVQDRSGQDPTTSRAPTPPATPSPPAPSGASTRTSDPRTDPATPGDAGSTVEAFGFNVTFDELLKGPVMRTAADTYSNATGGGLKSDAAGIFKLVSATFTMTEASEVLNTNGVHVKCEPNQWVKKCYRINFEAVITRNRPEADKPLVNMSWCGGGYDRSGAILGLRYVDCVNVDYVSLGWQPLRPTKVAGQDGWALGGSGLTSSREDFVMKVLASLVIKVSTGWGPIDRQIALDVPHKSVLAPEETMLLVPVVHNRGNVPLDFFRLRVTLDVEVGQRAPFGFQDPRAAWAQEYRDQDIHLAREASTDPGGTSWFARATMTEQRHVTIQPGSGMYLPPVYVKTGRTPGTFQVRGTATLQPLAPAGHTSAYQVTDVTKPCPEGQWEISGTASGGGFVVGGERWTWTATCYLKSDLKAVGTFTMVEAGVLLDLGGSEANFKGIVTGAPYASDMSGWFSGVVAQLTVDVGVVNTSGGAVYAHWYGSDTAMRVVLWWGELTNEVAASLAEATIGDKVADTIDKGLRHLVPGEPWKGGQRTVCSGTAGKGLSKVLSGKACGFWGHSTVGGT